MIVEDATIQWDVMIDHLVGLDPKFTVRAVKNIMEPMVVRVVAHKEGQVG